MLLYRKLLDMRSVSFHQLDWTSARYGEILMSDCRIYSQSIWKNVKILLCFGVIFALAIVKNVDV